MKVTHVWPHIYSSKSLRGFADVQLDGCVTIKGFKIFERQNEGLVVSLPQRKDDKGKTDEQGKPIYYDVLRINRDTQEGQDFYDHLTEEVLNAYNAAVSEDETAEDDEDDDTPF